MTPIEELAALRWPNGVECPHCGAEAPYLLQARERFACSSKLCRRQFSATTGTVFRYRKLPPETYVKAIREYPNCDSITSFQAALGVDYRTAFKIWHSLKETGGKIE